MLDALKRLLADRASPPPTQHVDAPVDNDLHLAACALLLEVAHADGEFSEVERARLELALKRHFGLDDAAMARLIDDAERERENSVDHFAFTSKLVAGYDTGQKMLLAEIMWGIILADGEVADDESIMVRKLAGLLQLEPAYLSQARRTATESPR